MKSIEEYQAFFSQAGWSFAHYFLTYAQTYQDNFDTLDQESANFLIVRAWLTEYKNTQSAQLLVALTKALTSYLHRPEQAAELLNYCQSTLWACERLAMNPGWALLLRYEAYNFLGEWDNALADAQTAVKITQDADAVSHARAMLALGCLQFNRGDYQVALNTLAEAEKLLIKIHDLAGIATVRAELAAYYLNRGELDKALKLYLEVDALRQRIDPTGPTDHTLLMLGVVYRKKRDYQQAAKYLLKLLHRGKDQGKRAVIATASHHLAWLHLDQKNLPEAYRLAIYAKQLYLKIGDPRGDSDVDEQLGLIAMTNREWITAEFYLKCSLNIRKKLVNQQGTASSLRNLSNLYFYKGNIWLGFFYLWCSCVIYWNLGVLSRQRIVGMAKQTWQLVMEQRRWKAQQEQFSM